MSDAAFLPTDGWPLQEVYKRQLHSRIQNWGARVAPMLEGLPGKERQPRERFLTYLATSVERGDPLTAHLLEALDGYARDYVEGPGPYGRGGGSIESHMGHSMCQGQFKGLYAIFEAGRLTAHS